MCLYATICITHSTLLKPDTVCEVLTKAAFWSGSTLEVLIPQINDKIMFCSKITFTLNWWGPPFLLMVQLASHAKQIHRKLFVLCSCLRIALSILTRDVLKIQWVTGFFGCLVEAEEHDPTIGHLWLQVEMVSLLANHYVNSSTSYRKMLSSIIFPKFLVLVFGQYHLLISDSLSP